jgi:hypothetical protein
MIRPVSRQARPVVVLSFASLGLLGVVLSGAIPGLLSPAVLGYDSDQDHYQEVWD